MSATQKRKASPSVDEEASKRRFVGSADATPSDSEQQEVASPSGVPESVAPSDEAPNPPSDAALKHKARMERFKALQARQVEARKDNLKATAAEAQRMARDPKLLASIQRKHDIASHNLLKAETEEAGEDFERKRAWDYTIEESEKWDRRVAKKEKHRGNVAFQDYTQEASKAYKKQMRNLKPDVEQYKKDKLENLNRAVERGELEIGEDEDGEMVFIDRTGKYTTGGVKPYHFDHKPTKEALERLVNDYKKAEDARMKKRRDRGLKEDDGDVTYINAKNKQFNEKLARFYNKYTVDIRESFERGTAI